MYSSLSCDFLCFLPAHFTSRSWLQMEQLNTVELHWTQWAKFSKILVQEWTCSFVHTLWLVRASDLGGWPRHMPRHVCASHMHTDFWKYEPNFAKPTYCTDMPLLYMVPMLRSTEHFLPCAECPQLAEQQDQVLHSHYALIWVFPTRSFHSRSV